jgi:hypothetical protein
MKKAFILTALVLAVSASIALAVDAYSVKQVRDPRVLAAKLTADFTSVVSTSDAARVTALEATAVTNATAATVVTPQTAAITVTVAATLATNTIIYLGATNDVLTNTFIYVPAKPTASFTGVTNATAVTTMTLERN